MLFGSGHSCLSDGRLLGGGGGGDGTGPRHNHGWIFNPDPSAETWTRTVGNGAPSNGDMAYHRWYPTLVTLWDEPGRALVVSGADTGGADVNHKEVYLQTSNRRNQIGSEYLRELVRQSACIQGVSCTKRKTN